MEFKSTYAFRSFLVLIILVYSFGLYLRFNPSLDSLVHNLPLHFVFIFNIFLFLFGVPLTIICDVILYNNFGLIYICLASLVVSIVTNLHVILLRNFQFNKYLSFFSNSRRMNAILLEYQSISSHNSIRLYQIFLVRSLPVLPFFIGSIFVSFSSFSNSKIFFSTYLASLIYYF